ncbi:alpha/beta hydrolase [Haliangium sp.]|uniref:alpha/beta hydrolase n=1 Tax=Haliangium sp. TaxID=2663208 RepID=UPI003D10D82E
MSLDGPGAGAPFAFPGAPGTDGQPPVAVLVVHGFTGTPFEVRHLGEGLSAHGHPCVGPLLRGHGTSPADLDATRWEDWVAGVTAAFDELRGQHERVAVVGQSLGGLLALYLAAERGEEMVAVGSLAAPLWLTPLARATVWATRPDRWLRGRLGRTLGALPKLRGSDVRDLDSKRQNPCYQSVPIAALHELVAFMEVVAGRLSAVRVPTLVMHGTQDHTAPYACSEHIAATVGAPWVVHRALAESYHLIAVDVERDLVVEEVAGFLARVSRSP